MATNEDPQNGNPADPLLRLAVSDPKPVPSDGSTNRESKDPKSPEELKRANPADRPVAPDQTAVKDDQDPK